MWFIVIGLSGNKLSCELYGNAVPQSSQLTEPLWTDPGLKNGMSMYELMSSKRKEKKGANREWFIKPLYKILACEENTTTTSGCDGASCSGSGIQVSVIVSLVCWALLTPFVCYSHHSKRNRSVALFPEFVVITSLIQAGNASNHQESRCCLCFLGVYSVHWAGPGSEMHHGI